MASCQIGPAPDCMRFHACTLACLIACFERRSSICPFGGHSSPSRAGQTGKPKPENVKWKKASFPPVPLRPETWRGRRKKKKGKVGRPSTSTCVMAADRTFPRGKPEGVFWCAERNWAEGSASGSKAASAGYVSSCVVETAAV